MATLPIEDQQKIAKGLQRYWSRIWSECDFNKLQLATAIEELDIWYNDNQIAANNSLSEPFKSDATVPQKALLTIGIVLMRYGDAVLLEAILGGLD
jgi:hypothetical protein